MIEQLRQGRWILLAGLLLIGGGVLFTQVKRDEVPAHPLGLAPAGAELIAHIDVGAVLGSHLFDVLLEEDSDGDVRRVEETCGYDPLSEVDRALVFSMGSERPFEQLGFVAQGELAQGRDNRGRLVQCVRDVLRGRGGGVSSTEVEGLSAVASDRGDSVAAFFGEDAVLGGDRDLVAETVRVARGQASSAATDADLRAVFDRLRGSDLTVVGRLPEAWLPSMMRMASGMDPALGALLSVRTLGLGAELRGGVDLRLVLRSSDDDAPAIEDAVNGQAAEFLRDLRVRLSVVGTVLRGLEVERSGPDVAVRVRASDAQIDALRELMLELAEEPSTPAPETADGTPEPPSNPAPSDQAPSDPVPSDPVPSDPVPSDPVPSDPVPSDPVPSDPVPSDPASTP